jgi:hypothetical protein
MISAVRDALVDRKIRANAALSDTPLDRYRVCIARDVEEYEDAFHLLHVAYAFQGIENVRSNKMRITPQHVLPEATVFVAYEGEQCVGTMTVTLDSPAGIRIENNYPEAVAALRAKGAKLVEFGSLAVVRRCWGTGVTVLLTIAAAYWAINMLAATDIVMVVNPKVAPFYRAIYKFRPIGEVRANLDLTSPVLAMTTNTLQCVAHVRRHFSRPLSSGLTIADHLTRGLPTCIRIPAEVPTPELARWKLPRTVFQQLFIEKSDRLDTLDPITLSYLKRWRSDQTLERSA